MLNSTVNNLLVNGPQGMGMHQYFINAKYLQAKGYRVVNPTNCKLLILNGVYGNCSLKQYHFVTNSVYILNKVSALIVILWLQWEILHHKILMYEHYKKADEYEVDCDNVIVNLQLLNRMD